ncbi:MAG TPA: adenylosuccinate synthetase, partial [Solirubrobacteraceae bacterium]|nr:adenylosuccinate synthetase [Solirubrobacteraceae bacterium]
GEYETLPGWSEDVTECRSEDDLPDTARDYLQFIGDFVGVPIAVIGVGPSRDQIIWTQASHGMAGAAAAAAS